MLIVRTGQNEGAAYNINGTNLTESPTGTDNFNVGSWHYDFSGLTGAGRFYSSEFCAVIANGTQAVPQNDQDYDNMNDGFDDDEEGIDQEDDAALVMPDTSTIVTSITATLRFGFPSYQDAQVFETVFDSDTGATNGVIGSTLGTYASLAGWLDDQFTALGEASGEGDNWWDLRAFLRWSMHWAIYKVTVSDPTSEQFSDDVTQSGLGPPNNVPQIDTRPVERVPEYGPAGLLHALGQEDLTESVNPFEWQEAQWIRLWESDLPIRYEYRGTIDGLSYALNTTSYNNAGIIGPHQGSEFEVLDVDHIATGTQDETTDLKAWGRELRLTIKRRCNIHVGQNEMLILHVQTGRARLQEPSSDNGVYAPGIIIGGTDLPVCGPKLTLHHFRVFARARHKRLRR